MIELSARMKEVKIQDWGLIDYQDAWDRQSRLLDELVNQKKKMRSGEISVKEIPHKLILCEHPHVYTLGRSGKKDHLLMTEDQLLANEVKFYKINRGGDITYHGPGQLVVYPIFDLDEFFNDVHKYVRSLEEIVIRVLAEYKVIGCRLKGFTGVWIKDDESDRYKKISAIGVHLSRWVSMHGLALNVNNDLSFFQGIIPCGIQEDQKDITNLSIETGRIIELNEVKEKMVHHFQNVFPTSGCFY